MKTISRKEKPYYICFETLGNKLRLEIVQALTEKEMCVNDLSKKISAERSRVSHSLVLLKRCGIIKSRKDGKKQVYFLDERLKKALKKDNALVALSSFMNSFCPACRCSKK